jgi:multisubunit Na+/H+ antiporter MnhF subunit
MIDVIAKLTLVVSGLVLAAALYRIVAGPTMADRVAAADLVTTSIMAVAVLAGLLLDTHFYVDVVMALALLGFFGTVAYAKYVLGGTPVDD